MNYKLLTPYELAELWSQIQLKAERLAKAAYKQSILESYTLFDELQSLKTKMQRHETVKALQNAIELY